VTTRTTAKRRTATERFRKARATPPRPPTPRWRRQRRRRRRKAPAFERRLSSRKRRKIKRKRRPKRPKKKVKLNNNFLKRALTGTDRTGHNIASPFKQQQQPHNRTI